jgi:serine/threonine protein phosphatase PrpC
MGNPLRKRDGEPSPLSINHGVCTHIGQRPQNQDSMLAISGDWGHLFAVADGMGGHSGGALASRLACERLADFFTRQRDGRDSAKPDVLNRRLVEAVIRTDRFIRWYGRSQGALADMGTTLSCLLMAGTHSVIAHVGDSRIYRWRDGHLSLLTVDHTFVQDMIFEGEITPSEALLHPFRHMLTRTLGTVEPLEFVDSRVDEVNAGDRFLLCTDGLTGTLNERLISETLGGPSNADSMASGLVDRALRNGARDNITAVVVRPSGGETSGKQINNGQNHGFREEIV